jgi:DinB family protein
MKTRKFLAVGVLVLMALSVFAANAGAAPTVAAGECAKHFVALRQLSMQVAQAMPAEQYGFRPHPDSMDFGALLSHIATTNFQFCAGLQDSQNANAAFAHREGRGGEVSGRFV